MNTTIELAKLIGVGIAHFIVWLLSWALAFSIASGVAYLTYKLVMFVV